MKNLSLNKKIRKLKPHEDCDFKTETIQMNKITIDEQHYNLDLDKNLENSIIQYEFNLIELPIFSKDKKIENNKGKKYVFSERDNSYVYIIPSANPKSKSNKILQEFDEKIFYAIMLLSRIQKSRVVITDYFTLMSIAGIKYDGEKLERVKDSIERMKTCVIEINGAFYNTIERKGNLNTTINILQTVEILTFDKFLELSNEKQKKYENYFRNSKIKEILILTLNDDIYNNIENKGYLNFDSDKLLKIDNAVARKLYILLIKWQGWQKEIKITRSCRFLASRIPLSFNAKNICGTIQVLENACKILIANPNDKLLKGYTLIKTKPIANSSIEFEFFTTHDHDLLKDKKQKQICIANQKLAVETGHENLSIVKEETIEIIDVKPIKVETVLQSKEKTNITEESNKLIAMLPVEHREKKLMQKLIYQYFKTHGFEYVKRNIEYSNAKSKNDYYAYLAKALIDDWGLAWYEKKQIDMKIEEQKQKVILEAEKAQREGIERERLEREKEKKEIVVVQAGAMLWLADVTASVLVLSGVMPSEDMKGFPFAISLNAHFLSNQREGSFRAVASFVKKGRNVSIVRTVVYGESDRIIADVTTSHVLST